MAEYPLPWMGGGFEKQHEGMALVRKKSMNESDNNNGPKLSLTLYFPPDKLAMVWKIAINDGIAVR